MQQCRAGLGQRGAERGVELAGIGDGVGRAPQATGDGSSMYGIQALWTAAREGAAVTFVVLDNAEYAAVRLLGEAAGATKLPGVALGGIDFVAVARGLGCAAHAVTDPGELDAALRAALAEPGPTLLHLPVAAQSVTPY